jgi:hypothetical protein
MNGRRMGLGAGSAALILSAHLLGGCLTEDAPENPWDTTTHDLFPRPFGEYMIPLEMLPTSPDERGLQYTFAYAAFDTAGRPLTPEPLDLYVFNKTAGGYAYSFGSANQGFLIRWSDGNGLPDSAGIYIVGRFTGATVTFDAAPILWLPQAPRPGVKWNLDPDRYMELVSADTAVYTPALFTEPDEIAKAPIQYGFQRQPTYLFRETYGDVVSYYHFRRGVGLVAFERSRNGLLLASGTLRAFRVGRVFL